MAELPRGMLKDLPKAYDPAAHEAEILQCWDRSGFFNPDNLPLPPEAENFTIILPPPNITDKLHLGHAAMLAIEDLFARYQRMKGKRVLWLPGTDHAAIATQTAVEKKLKKEEGKTRHDLGREAFLQKINEFIQTTQSVIIKQIKAIGASLDWSRLAFTLDQPRQAAVKEMFCQLFEAGLIYRGERVVNWCPRCASTLADDEVEYKTESTKLYTFLYDQDFPISIATTRPETKLGDTAICVNPQDKRYVELVGKELTANFCSAPLRLRVIADSGVDPEFGTGALGVTPAHAMADWLLAQNYNLPLIKVIDEQGKIRPGFNQFSGQTAAQARTMIVQELRHAGLLQQEEEIEHNLSICYRCGTPLEPLLSKQWFVAVDKPIERLQGKSLKQAAIEAVTSGQIKFIPEHFTKRYLDWMTNLRDWCVSRQIWFGHSLPVYYHATRPDFVVDSRYNRSNTQHATQGNKKNCDGPIVSREKLSNCPHCGSELIQDQDTLDTWFSSGMWTFSTLGWPSSVHNKAGTMEGKPNKIIKSGDLARFHPTDVLETGYEIISLWVSRMIMLSWFALEEIPFKTVYLHGMILDKLGKKMSKSAGNGIDPLEMIKAYGGDAMRLALLLGAAPGADVRIDEQKIAGMRNLVNKLWNIARFISLQLEQITVKSARPQTVTLSDQWILAELDRLVVKVTGCLDKYDFSQAGEELKNFTWNDLADWYLEIAKIEKGKEGMLAFILNTLLKLWHPFMPVVTEKLWREIYQTDQLLMVAEFPSFAREQVGIKESEPPFTEITLLQEAIKAIRHARAEHKISPNQPIKTVIYAKDQTRLLQEQAELLKNLRTGIGELVLAESGQPPASAIKVDFDNFDIYLVN